MEYKEDDFLMLSGIQHFAFCPRQWALIHLEEQWRENFLTASGRLMHEKAHDNAKYEKRGDTIITRALKVFSPQLGITGECDVVEFRKNENGVPLRGCKGLFLPYPVEYKKGKSKENDCDRLQLCAQAMCLEEMLGCDVPSGALFYGEPKKRETVDFDPDLRQKTQQIVTAMHETYDRRYTPRAEACKRCAACSLKEECLPKLGKKNLRSVSKYLEDALL